MKLAELLPNYLNYALTYKKSYSSDFSKVNKYIFPGLGDIDIHEMKKRDITAYLQSLDGLQNSTRNRHLALLKAILSWTVDQGHLDSSPAIGMKSFRERVSLRRAMEPSEYSVFIKTLRDEIQVDDRDTLQLLPLLVCGWERLVEPVRRT